MTDLARNGSILVAEIKAVHPAPGSEVSNGTVPVADGANGAVPLANGGANGSTILPPDAAAAAPLDSSVTDPVTHPHLQSAHAAEASGLTAGAGAIAVPHQADPSVASGIVEPAAAPAAAPAGGEAAGAPGLIQPQTSTIESLQPSEQAREVSHINTAVPAAGVGAGAAGAAAAAAAHHHQDSSAQEPTSAVSAGQHGTAPGSAISAPYEQQQQPPQQLNAVASSPTQAGAPSFPPGTIVPASVTGAGGAGAAAAAAAPAATSSHPAPTTVAANTAPKSALSPKEIKKMDKLMKKEAKDEYKALKRAIKDAKSSEKLFRKSRDAEAQTVKRHQKAQTNEHKASKALSKAKAEHEKYAADLSKTFEDLDIKKRHTESTRTGYEEAKRRIDELRNQKTVNDQARSRQAAELHGIGGR
ncbi:DNA binding protein [Pseudozyma hubeiensis]|nr:DNA binding protein [Pseudozyma hubeiensis]